MWRCTNRAKPAWLSTRSNGCKPKSISGKTARLTSRIRSPIAGIVVAGDLAKSQGVPLTVGQTLFEIAPLEAMIVEIAIPEDDIRFVTSRMCVDIRLDAFPFERWSATLDRISPRSELKDNENVFIGEATIPNPGGKLRPGMRGKARITTIRRPLGWNLFHKALAAVAGWMGW